ncbi:nucleotidyltransferase family protein [uncultured Rhodoblastus sp.]|uniref:nucleotidyltransferase family protein n=1 Tax=uncultured Rhodoblastus sp. TaxID=543037 RepID=UPI0025F92616|nr:nucleotidyltransferase family protein [uncultured Rhodoblastus sp.]
MSVAAILLAAGRASRFGAGPDDSKVLARIEGVSLLARVAGAAARSRASSVVAVVGHASSKVEAELNGFDFDIVRNENLDLGLSHSLRLGLAGVPASASAAVVLLADMPYVSAEIIDALISGFETERPEPLAVMPVYRGARGNPVLLSRKIFAEAENIRGDRGARHILDQMPLGVLDIPMASDSILLDIDTPEMLGSAANGFRFKRQA